MSSYIGNFSPQQVFPENTRDDIVPAPPQATFVLSQEVPGGYESNVLVFRKKFKKELIIEGTSDLEFFSGTNEIVVTGNSLLSSLLSRIQVGETISIEGAVEVDNNGNHLVVSVTYNDPDITFVVASALQDEDSNPVDVFRGFDSPWETLQPETDYTIGGTVPNKDKEITFSQIPQEEDEIYVIHRGAATYNFVPTNNSVSPEALSHNLRNFVVDRFEGDGVETDFTLSQESVNSKTILVTVDGEVLDGDDPMAPPFPFVGDWELVNEDTVSFHVAPILGAKIRVLHLGFSTVSRRASLSAGQVGAVPPNSITQLELSTGSVTTPKIANDAVTSNKILLDNNQALRGRKTDTNPTGLVKVGADDRTVILSETEVRVEINSNPILDIDEDKIEPVTDNVIDIGSPTNKIKDIHTYFINGIDISSLGGLPPGFLGMTATPSAPSGWLICHGQEVSRVTFANLFAAIGTTYGPGDGIATFNVPDFRQRLPIGRTDALAQPASNLGASFGSINHTHDFTHSHNVSTTATLPDHLHGIGTIAGTHAHTHTIDHVHDVTHEHLVPRHRHTDYSLVTTNSGSHTHSIGFQTNSGGGTSRRSVRGFTESKDGDLETSGGTHTHAIDPGGRVGPSGATNADNPALNAYFTTGSVAANAAGFFTVGTTKLMNNIGIKAATSNISGPASTTSVTMSGNTGNPTTSPNVDSTGNTTSQDTASTGSANPPCLTINFIIKT